MVLKSLDNHPVLASAAYNAGPAGPANGARINRWKARSTPKPSRLQNRDYVKKVMSNAV